MPKETTSFRADEKTIRRLAALKNAKVGKDKTDIICLSIECLCNQHGITVEG